MNKLPKAALVCILCFIGLAGGAVAAQDITNYEAPGNLQSFNAVACIGIDETKPTYTPADLYPGMMDCVEKQDFDAAAKLFALAGVYGRFDTMRVSDKTAHQAITILKMGSLGTLEEEDSKDFKSAIVRLTSNPEALSSLCASLRKLGPPSYEPVYMRQHGMGAFLGAKKDLPKDFDAVSAFEAALDQYLHCPA